MHYHCSAEVERTFSGSNNNKNKLKNRLTVYTFEAISKPGDNFQGDFEVNQRLVHLYGKETKMYFEKFEFLKLLLMRLFPCDCNQLESCNYA